MHEDAHPPLSIKLFGLFSAQYQGEPLRALGMKGQWLLTLLILQNGREVQRGQLADWLFPYPDYNDPRLNLRQLVSDVRRALGNSSYLPGPTLSTLRFELGAAKVDLIDFFTAIKHGSRGDIASLKQAVALYRGPLLQGCEEDWIVTDRTECEQKYQAALEKLANYTAACYDYAAAADYLRLAIAANPAKEAPQRALMQILAKGGDYRGEAQVYQALCAYLRKEFDQSPEPVTIALHHQLQEEAKHQAEESLVILPRDPATPPPGNLPIPLTPLVGQQEEIRQIKTSLSSSRLVTLTGTGGVGKTRLATQVAEEVANDYRDGAWFVSLADLSDPRQVTWAVADVLGVKETPGQPLEQTLLESLKPKTVLLVLDNCEHLLSSCAAMVRTLLAGCRYLRVLATSRQPLGFIGESLRHVPSLSMPDPKQISTHEKDLTSLQEEYEAIQLFVQRAQAVEPAFRLTPYNASLVAQICWRLDGIPFAIELAAARVKALSVDVILVGLDDRFHLLVGEDTAALPRHQTLLATMDWSYALLDADEKWLFTRLSVFTGGWTLAAAEVVGINRISPGLAEVDIEKRQVRNLLPRLVNQSLVKKITTIDQEGKEQTRYWFLETTHEYARVKLSESGEAEVVYQRHQDYFLVLAEQHRDINRGENRTILDLELLNIDVAAQIAADNRDWECTSRLTNAMGPFLMMRGRWSLREQMNQRVLSVLKASSDPDTTEKRAGAEAVALDALGVVARVRGQWAESEQWFHASIAVWDRCLNGGDKWKSRINLGILYRSQHRLAEAQAELSGVIKDIGDTLNTVTHGCAYVNLGVVLQMQGRYAEAEQHLNEGLTMLSSHGHRIGEAQAMNNRGILNRARWRLKESERDFRVSLERRGPNGGASGIAQAQSNLASVLQMLGQLDESDQVALAALEVRRPMGNREGEAASLTNLAMLREMRGRHDDAEKLLNEALAICLDLKDKVGLAEVLHNLGVVRFECGRLQADDDFNQSLDLCRSYNDIEGIGRALLNLANVARGTGNFTEAEQRESEVFTVYPMIKEQLANFAAEWARDAAIGERFHSISYFTNQAAGDDLCHVVARTLARFRWWDTHAALDAE